MVLIVYIWIKSNHIIFGQICTNLPWDHPFFCFFLKITDILKSEFYFYVYYTFALHRSPFVFYLHNHLDESLLLFISECFCCQNQTLTFFWFKISSKFSVSSDSRIIFNTCFQQVFHWNIRVANWVCACTHLHIVSSN